MLKIMFITSELIPYYEDTKKSNVMCALPKALRSIGNDVRVIAPRFRTIRGRRAALRDISRLKSIPIPFAGQSYKADIKSGFIPNSHVQIYFIDYTDFYDREGVYGGNEGLYEDNFKRFAFLVYAGLIAEKTLGWKPDVVHCCGPFLSLAPLIIRKNPLIQVDYARVKLVLHIGPESESKEAKVPLSDLGFLENNVTTYVNLPLDGLKCADLVLTNIDCMGSRIKGLNIHPWLDGVDIEHWNPEVDSALVHKYGLENVEVGKMRNRLALQHQLGWEDAETHSPLAVMWLSSLTPETIGILKNIENDLAGLPMRWVIVGDSSQSKDLGLRLTKQWGKPVVNIETNNERLLRLALASADMLILPDPKVFGKPNPFAALPYGTVPIVCKNEDITLPFKEYEPHCEDGCGFSFPASDYKKMVEMMDRALTLYNDHERWLSIQRRAMKTDCSWRQSARKLVELYNLTPLRPESFAK